MSAERDSLMSEATDDAFLSVNRETDTAIITPDYTPSALSQMGMERSYGRSRKYRMAFATAFVKYWLARYDALTGEDQ
jgi:hypothetical protein